MNQSAFIVLGEFSLLVAVIGFGAWEVWTLKREKRDGERKAREEQALASASAAPDEAADAPTCARAD